MRDVMREGADEVRAKLREDLSRWTRTRRYVSLKPEIGCLACDAAGKIECAACGGTGRSAVVLDDGRQESCPRCDGSGATTCVECAGRGRIANRHRRTMLWLLVVGGIAWLMILFQLWGRDVLPEQRAAILQRGEHGRAVQAPPPRAPRPGSSSNVAQPATGGNPPTLQQRDRFGPTSGTAPQGYAPGAGGMSHGNSVTFGGAGQTRTGFPPAPPPGQGYGTAGTPPSGVGVNRPYGGGNSVPSRQPYFPR
jgi:hypothetical protein